VYACLLGDPLFQVQCEVRLESCGAVELDRACTGKTQNRLRWGPRMAGSQVAGNKAVQDLTSVQH